MAQFYKELKDFRVSKEITLEDLESKQRSISNTLMQ